MTCIHLHRPVCMLTGWDRGVITSISTSRNALLWSPEPFLNPSLVMPSRYIIRRHYKRGRRHEAIKPFDTYMFVAVLSTHYTRPPMAAVPSLGQGECPKGRSSTFCYVTLFFVTIQFVGVIHLLFIYIFYEKKYVKYKTL